MFLQLTDFCTHCDLLKFVEITWMSGTLQNAMLEDGLNYNQQKIYSRTFSF